MCQLPVALSRTIGPYGPFPDQERDVQPLRIYDLDRYAGFSIITIQQSCQLRLKLQSTNSITVLLGVDAGINDFVEQCQT